MLALSACDIDHLEAGGWRKKKAEAKYTESRLQEELDGCRKRERCRKPYKNRNVMGSFMLRNKHVRSRQEAS